MVTTVEMIESEMGYRAANPFTTQQFFPYFLLLTQLLHLKPSLKSIVSYTCHLDHRIWVVKRRENREALIWIPAVERR
jgi:hypothetical protein